MKNSLRIHKWTHNEFNIFILGVLTHPLCPNTSAEAGVCQNDASSFFTNKAPTFTSQGFVMSKRFCTFRH